MLFHYVHGALMCEIELKGLTSPMAPRRFDYLDSNGSSPTDPLEYDQWYGGYRHFVCESMSRSTASRIATALGGYLVDDSYINVGRQLGDGSPFHVHLFDLVRPAHVATFSCIDDALDRAHECSETWPVKYPFRIYDASGYMVMEVKRDA